MKQVLILFFFFALFSCQKDSELTIPPFDFRIHSPGDQLSGKAEADVFNKPWGATAYTFPGHNIEYFSVIFETYSPIGYMRDQVSFGLFKALRGEYLVTNIPFDSNHDDNIISGKYNLWGADGDVLYGNYIIDTLYTNRVIIDQNDGEIIKGRFDLHFVTGNGTHSVIPGKVHFKNGTFQIKK